MSRFCRIGSLILLIAVFLFNCSFAAAGEKAENEQGNLATAPQIEAQSAIVTDQAGNILYKKNEHSRVFPASTTKILTALLAVENCDLDESVAVGKEITLIPSYSGRCGLQEGETITMRELMYGLLLRSGNDAALSIAVNVARKANPDKALSDQESLSLFAWMMNQRALAIGAKDSHFVNPHGLHDPQHYSTAYDLALIAREAMKNRFLSQVVATWTYSPSSQVYNPSGQPAVWTNTNKLLDEKSPFYLAAAVGVKTGHTDEAGYCLVSAAGKKQSLIYAVVLKSSQNGIWKDSINLLNYGFKHPAPVSKKPAPPRQKTRLSSPGLSIRSYSIMIGVGILLLLIVSIGFARMQYRAKGRP